MRAGGGVSEEKAPCRELVTIVCLMGQLFKTPPQLIHGFLCVVLITFLTSERTVKL